MAHGKRQRLAERRLAGAIADRLKAQQPQRAARGWWWWTTRAIAFLVGLFGLCAGAYQFRPLVAVSLEAPLDPRDAFSNPFVATNAGWLSVYSVAWSCYFNGLETKKLGRTRQGHTTLETNVLAALTPDDRVTAQCWRSVGIERGDELLSADLSVFVDYFWFYWPRRLTKEARFATKRAADGTLRWLPQPVPDRRTEGGRLSVVPPRRW